MPLVALVGYTNAGKSSLLNQLCAKVEGGEEVYADDQLFATLDPTLRRLRLAWREVCRGRVHDTSMTCPGCGCPAGGR